MSTPPPVSLSPNSLPRAGERDIVSQREVLADEAVIDIRNLYTRFGDNVVHDDISIKVMPGEIFALVGGSGCGKSTCCA
ncbi:MAG: ATP-binding cassette domain-containing protein, partial [Gallionella sp.]